MLVCRFPRIFSTNHCRDSKAAFPKPRDGFIENSSVNEKGVRDSRFRGISWVGGWWGGRVCVAPSSGSAGDGGLSGGQRFERKKETVRQVVSSWFGLKSPYVCLLTLLWQDKMVFSLATNVLKTRAPVVGRRFLAGGPGPTQSPLVPQAIKDQQAHFQQNPHLHGTPLPTPN
jgi:hypothetical protein